MWVNSRTRCLQRRYRTRFDIVVAGIVGADLDLRIAAKVSEQKGRDCAGGIRKDLVIEVRRKKGREIEADRSTPSRKQPST